jgi:hypothetical protein
MVGDCKQHFWHFLVRMPGRLHFDADAPGLGYGSAAGQVTLNCPIFNLNGTLPGWMILGGIAGICLFGVGLNFFFNGWPTAMM